MDEKNVKTKGSAYNQPEHIKKKSKWTKKTTVWVIILAVIVLGILAIIGANNGWFKTQDMINGKIELEDYSTIEIDKSAVEVTDDTVNNYLTNIISQETTYEEVTEGTVEDGDVINLDYSGVLAGEEEPFEGGTAEGSSLTIGSDTMIDGFEDQIIGHEIGETFDIDVTFPEDYTTADLAGKDATFTITVNSKTVSTVPEMSDELVASYTAEHADQFEETIETVDELKEYYIEKQSDSYLESAIMSAMDEKANVVYYNEADLATMTDYSMSALSYYASMFGTDTQTMAEMYGASSPEEYAENEAKATLKQTMITDKVAEEQNISYTDEELNEVLTKYMENEGFTGTLEEFKEQSGDAFMLLVSKTEVLMPKVVDYLKGNVVMVESEESEETAEEAAGDGEETVEEAKEETAAAEETVVETEAEAEEETEAETEAEKEVKETEAESEAEAEDTEVETEAESEEKVD